MNNIDTRSMIKENFMSRIYIIFHDIYKREFIDNQNAVKIS